MTVLVCYVSVAFYLYRYSNIFLSYSARLLNRYLLLHEALCVCAKQRFITVCVCRKEAEISSLNTKLESEQSLVAQLQKKIKELQVIECFRFFVVWKRNGGA